MMLTALSQHLVAYEGRAAIHITFKEEESRRVTFPFIGRE